jgi:hypothetical protein
MPRFFLRIACAAALPVFAGGCATLSDSPQQQLEVHAILDNREVAGVGCVLQNDVGRWFVVAPGRITVDRSSAPLTVDCRRQDAGGAREQVASRFDTDKLIGNAMISAGLGYFVDRHSGAGFSYPSTLTVIMRPPAAEAQGQGAPAAGNVVF